MSHDRYRSPLGTRYASPAMQSLWGEKHRIGLWRRGFQVAQVAYSLFYIHTVNGSSGEHIAQYIQGRVGWPLFGRFGLGAAGALYLRNSHYEDFDDTFNKHPEVRAFLSWRFE